MGSPGRGRPGKPGRHWSRDRSGREPTRGRHRDSERRAPTNALRATRRGPEGGLQPSAGDLGDSSSYLVTSVAFRSQEAPFTSLPLHQITTLENPTAQLSASPCHRVQVQGPRQGPFPPAAALPSVLPEGSPRPSHQSPSGLAPHVHRDLSATVLWLQRRDPSHPVPSLFFSTDPGKYPQTPTKITHGCQETKVKAPSQGHQPSSRGAETCRHSPALPSRPSRPGVLVCLGGLPPPVEVTCAWVSLGPRPLLPDLWPSRAPRPRGGDAESKVVEKGEILRTRSLECPQALPQVSRPLSHEPLWRSRCLTLILWDSATAPPRRLPRQPLHLSEGPSPVPSHPPRMSPHCTYSNALGSWL